MPFVLRGVWLDDPCDPVAPVMIWVVPVSVVMFRHTQPRAGCFPNSA